MIIKTLRWKVGGFGRLVNYVGKELIDYVAKEGDERLEILHNLRPTDDLGDIARQFAENDAFRKRRKNGVTMYHEILSFAPRDREAITPPDTGRHHTGVPSPACTTCFSVCLSTLRPRSRSYSHRHIRNRISKQQDASYEQPNLHPCTPSD